MEPMYRQIFTARQDSLNVNVPIPNEWKGMDIEIIAFPVSFPEEIKKEMSIEERRRKRDELLDKHLIDLSDFKFNRDEANDYD